VHALAQLGAIFAELRLLLAELKPIKWGGTPEVVQRTAADRSQY